MHLRVRLFYSYIILTKYEQAYKTRQNLHYKTIRRALQMIYKLLALCYNTSHMRTFTLYL